MLRNLAARRVLPELLDGLSPDDPLAVASRRDLKRINALMFHAAIMSRLLRRHTATQPSRMLDIGGGDGTFMLAVARRLAKHWSNLELIILDQAEAVACERQEDFARLGWRMKTVSCDVFEWIANADEAPFDAVTANLFLHHFSEPDLARLLAALRPLTPVFVAAEPRRAGVALAASSMLWAIGANKVTLHDAPASVRAGFSGREISALWPVGEGDVLEERRVGPFTHIFAAAKPEAMRP